MKAKPTIRRTTSYLPWETATGLIKKLEDEGRHDDALLIAAGIYFGLRISDILQLTWEEIRSTRFEIAEQKTGKVRRIEPHADFAEVRKRAEAARPEDEPTPADEDLVFPGRWGKKKRKRLTVAGANYRLKAAFDRHGIETENASSHTLRKTFARRVWEKNGRDGSSLILLSDILGHSSTKVTRRYLGFTAEHHASVYRNL